MKKNKLLFLALFPVLFAFTGSVKKVTIEGRFDLKDEVDKIYLNYRDGKTSVRDSADGKDNRFKFEKEISEPVLSTIVFVFKAKDGETRPRFERMELFMEPGKINVQIKDSLKFAKVTGSNVHKTFEALEKEQAPFDKKREEYIVKYRELAKDREKNEGEMNKIEEEVDKLDGDMKEKVYRSFIQKNPNSPVALYALKEYAGYSPDAAKVEPLYQGLSAQLRESPSGVALKDEISIAKKTGVGAEAMDFVQNDTANVPVSLKSFRGKYVLLDFWASWCGPCRAENPNVVKAYNEFKDKGFTVLGVSLDQSGKKEAWLNAIHKDGLTWTHVSDLKFWDNDVAKQYGIRAIPQNFLIDPQGKIIAKNLHGEELQKKLAETLN